MRKSFILFVGVIFCLCTTMVMASTIDVDQIGALNTSTIYQAGTNQTIDVDQVTVNNNDVAINQDGGDSSVINLEQVTTGGDNDAIINQEDGVAAANNKSINAYQTAETGNTLIADQDHAGGDTLLTINQTATVGDNDAYVMQVGDAVFGSNTVINQVGSYNDLDIFEDLDSGGQSNTYLNQTAASNNYAYIDTDADTAGANTLTEALADGSVGSPGDAASQNSGSFNDFYWTSYGGDSELGLTQMAIDDNYAEVEQYDGLNSAGVYQDAGSWNDTYVGQFNGFNSLTLSQTAGTYNGTMIEQNGSDTAAVYQAAGLENEFSLVQSGGLNTANVYQDASDYNNASVNQYGGGNLLVANQITTGGFNQLNVEQAGGMNLTVDQVSDTNNVATVTQL